MRKYIIRCSLALCLLALSLNAAAWNNITAIDGPTWQDYAATSFASGDGTKGNPYQIATSQQLARLAKMFNDGSMKSGQYVYCVLTADIDLADKVDGKDVCWVPIGHLQRSAYCYLSGKGHTIKNMRIVSSATTNDGSHNFGLFGTLYGTVSSLNIANAYIEVSSSVKGSMSVGLLAGNCNPSKSDNNNNAIFQCSAQGVINVVNSIDSRKNNNYIGGLIGNMTQRTAMAQCQTNVKINVKSECWENQTFVGGIIGRSEANKYLLYDCAAHGDMVVSTRKNGFVGGIVGQAYMNIVACATTGKIVGSGVTYLGGIVGQFTANRVAANICMMELSGGQYLGGIVGNDRDKETVVNNIFSGHIDGRKSDRSGGIVGLCKDATNNNVYQGNLVKGTFVKHADADWTQAFVNPTSIKTKDSYVDNNMADFNGDQALAHTRMTSGVRTDCSLAGYYDGFKWEYRDGFYPRLTLNDAYLKANTDDGIRSISSYFPGSTVGAPILFPDYARLASVPLLLRKMVDNLCKVYRLDYPFPIDHVEVDGKTFSYVLPDAVGNMSVSEGKLQLRSPGLEQIEVRCGSLSKRLCLNVVVGSTYEWGKDYNVSFEGTGAQSTPYLIRTARQLEQALRSNKANEYYKLTQDIWLNHHLVSINGTRNDAKVLNQALDEYRFTWNAHLDGDSHFIRGMNINLGGKDQTQVRTGLVAVNKGTIENLAVVDAYMMVDDNCDVASASLLAGTNEGTIRNCIVQGVVTGQRTTAAGICGTLTAGGVVEDCIASVVFRNVKQAYSFTTPSALSATNCRRCLSLSVISNAPQNTQQEGTECIYPEGFLSNYNTTQEDMTLGTGLGNADRWTSKHGRYPMLKSFETSGYGLLLSLPVKATKENPLYDIKSHIEFVNGGADWTTSHSDCFDVSNELEVIAPIQTGSSGDKFMMATAGDDRVLVPIKLSSNFTKGIRFASSTVGNYCINYFDIDKDGRLSLSEIAAVNNDKLKSVLKMMGNRCDRFPELKYFKGITQLTDELQGLTELWDVRLPAGLTRLGSDAFKGCTALSAITLPNSLTTIDPHPFYGSNIIDVSSDSIDCYYKVRENMLFDANDNLVAYPNALKTTYANGRSMTLSGKVNKILRGAIYRVEGLDTVYINAPTYQDFTQLAPGGIVHSKATSETESAEMVIYVNDATTDGVLFKQYQQDSEWADYQEKGCLKRYYPLNVTDALYATLYIGFNTKLPAALKPFIAHAKYTSEELVTLVITDNKLPKETPVVIKAEQAGTYILEPYEGNVEAIPLYLNKLIGTGRDGKPVYQSDASEGNLLTLGHNANGALGFYYYKNANGTVPPYKAYLNVNSITNRAAVFDESASNRAYGNGMVDGFTYEIKRTFWGRKYYAVLTGYIGSTNHLKVPNTVTASVEGSQQEVPVTEMSRGIFRDIDNLKSIDLSACTNMDAVTVSRGTLTTSPFSGLSNDVLIYMPANRGHKYASDQPNVVIGNQCSWLSLNAGSEFFAPYDFTASKVTYDSELWATITAKDTEGKVDQGLDIDRTQGTEEALAPRRSIYENGNAGNTTQTGEGLFYTYTSKAYTLCLPFDIDLSKQANKDNDVMAYQLVCITDKQEFLFDEPTATLEAGKPYLIIVGKGHFTLQVDNANVVSKTREQTVDNDYVSDAVMGLWKGNFRPISRQQLAEENAFLMMDNGTWGKAVNADSNFSELPSFHAYFAATGYKGNGSKTVINGAGDSISFGGDMKEATGISTPYMHVVDHLHGDRYFDMSGREIQNKPDKGIYIYKGKKYMNK